MKSHILHILSLLLVVGISGCADEIEMPETVGGQEGSTEYTLELTLDDTQLSRGLNTVGSEEGIKSSWVIGDPVVLHVDNGDGTTSDYTFNCINTYNLGRTATFKHSSSTIPNATNVTGTLTYTQYTQTSFSEFTFDSATGKYINGCLKCVDNTTESADDVIEIKFLPWELQLNNNSSSHLGYIPLTATLTNFDLTQPQTVELKRNYSVLKIVLDDFYYPIYKGSVVFVTGLGERPALTDQTEFDNSVKRFMTLGKNSLISSKSAYQTCKYYKYDNTYKAPSNLDRFCPGQDDHYYPSTRPFTDYAVRNDTYKLVLYMVLLDEPEIQDGDMITVGLREQWSMDWYFWRTVPLRAMKMSLGGFYTLDFAKQHGGMYDYECTAAIYSGNSNQTRVLGHIATKNLGANSLIDPGSYYMFGYGDPMEPGGYFPNNPEVTPYYYYYENKLRFNKTLPGGSEHGQPEYAYFVTPSIYQAGKFNGTMESHKISFTPNTDKKQHIRRFWNEWVEGLRDMPTVFPLYITSQWTLLPNTRMSSSEEAQFDLDLFDKVELIGENGTLDIANPVGARFTVKRTKHQIFVPISGIYEPSEETEYQQAAPNATLTLIEGTDRYAAMAGYCLYMLPATTDAERDVKRVAFCFDVSQNSVGNIPCQKYYGLNALMPIRPAFREPPQSVSVVTSPNYFFFKYFNHQ